MEADDFIRWVRADKMLQLVVQAIAARDDEILQEHYLERIAEYSENEERRAGTDVMVEENDGKVRMDPDNLFMLIQWCHSGELHEEHSWSLCACRACQLTRWLLLEDGIAAVKEGRVIP